MLCHILDIMLKTGMNLDHFLLKNKHFKNGLLYVTCWAVSIVGHGSVWGENQLLEIRHFEIIKFKDWAFLM